MVTNTTWTGLDFEGMSWHDNPIYGVSFGTTDGVSDLVLDIDYIIEWICGTMGRASFRIAPATLVFHDVTDVEMHIDGMASGYQVGLIRPTVSHVRREHVAAQKVCLDRPYYVWTVELAVPGGYFRFGASGFTQALRREPVLSSEQIYPGAR
jgi:hypothetical protein